MVDSSTEKTQLCVAAQSAVLVAAWLWSDREAKVEQPPSHHQASAPGSLDPALQLSDLGLAGRLMQSWVHKSTHQLQGKGFPPLLPVHRFGLPMFPLTCPPEAGSKREKTMSGTCDYLGWGMGDGPPTPYTPEAASSSSYMKYSKTTATPSTEGHKMHPVTENFLQVLIAVHVFMLTTTKSMEVSRKSG